MKLINKIFIPILALGLSTAYSQADNETDSHNIFLTVPTIALLDIESAGVSNDISVILVAPEEAGDPLESKTDESLWLNVTSIVTTGSSNNIKVEIDQIVPGLDLKVSAAGYSGVGQGSWGTPASTELTLNTSAQSLVTGITSGYTGNGAGNGFKLSYTVDPDETAFDALLASSSIIIDVTYTLEP